MQAIEVSTRSRICHFLLLRNPGNNRYGRHKQIIYDGGESYAASSFSQLLVKLPVQFYQLLAPPLRVIGGFDHAMQAELDPVFPRTVRAYPKEQIEVAIAISVEVRAHVQPLIGQRAPFFNQYRQQKASNASIPIHEWMYGLELIVNEERLHERIEVMLSIQVLLELSEQFRQQLGRCRDETGWSSNLILKRPELSRTLVRSPNALHQGTVEVTNQSQR